VKKKILALSTLDEVENKILALIRLDELEKKNLSSKQTGRSGEEKS
jgi:hypothetical protein